MASYNPKRLKMSEDESCLTIQEETSKSSFHFGTSDFSTIVKSPGFIDKTLLVKELMYATSMVLITAPQYFGKSTNMDMVKKFVEIQVDAAGAIIDKEASSNYKIFKDNNLLIFQDKAFFDKHFATYAVLHTSFKSDGRSNFNRVLDPFRSILHNTFKQYEYLITSDKLESRTIHEFKRYYNDELYCGLDRIDIMVGLEFLSKCLYQHFDKKVFVLIDDYDAPINNTMFERYINVDEVTELLSGIFSNTLKGNEYVERCLLTGVSYFGTVALYGANNIEKYMFLDNHRYVPYYGLTEKEFDVLATRFQIDDEKKEQARKHYNGYVSLHGTKLFSMWSVLNFLKKKEIANYWQQSSTVTNLKKALNFPTIRHHIEKICRGESVVANITEKAQTHSIVELRNICLQGAASETNQLKKPDLYLAFIFDHGYLTYTVTYENVDYSELVALKAPNIEIIHKLQEILQQYYTLSLHTCLEECSVIFDKISSSSEDDIFQAFVTNFNKLLSKAKYIERNEDTYHCLMFSILCKSKFSLGTEITFSSRKVDLISYAGNLGIGIKITHEKSSRDALQAVVTRYLRGFYANRFEIVTEKIFLGINVNANDKVEVGVLVNSANVDAARIFT